MRAQSYACIFYTILCTSDKISNSVRYGNNVKLVCVKAAKFETVILIRSTRINVKIRYDKS